MRSEKMKEITKKSNFDFSKKKSHFSKKITFLFLKKHFYFSSDPLTLRT